MNNMTSDMVTMPVKISWTDIREAVGRLCEDFPNEYWLKLDKEDAYPHDFVKALTETGFLGALIPEEYGGSGLPISAAGAVLETIHAKGCNAAACHAQMYTMGTVLRHGSEEMKRKYLPKIATGELRLQAFGVTEPTTGSDTTQLKTKAEKTDHGTFVVNGQKVWTSRAFESDLMLLLARTTPADQCKKRSDGISAFLIDMNEAKKNGLSLSKIDAMINHNTCEVFFDDVEIPADTLVGEEGKGFRYIVDSMNAERILIAYESIGDAKFFIEKACEYARDRTVFGRSIGANQGIQFPIAKAYANAEAAELMVNKAAALFDSGAQAAEEANLAKLLAADASWEAAETCMQTYGGFAFAREYGIERKWREARLYQTAPVSKNMIYGYIGQHVLGLPRSY